MGDLCRKIITHWGGYEFSQGAITKKIKIFLNAYKNRETLKGCNPRAEIYLRLAMIYLGAALITGKECPKHRELGYKILTVAKQEYGANIDLPIKEENCVANPESSSTEDDLKDDFGHNKSDAMTVAKSVVKGYLKLPSTASFCSISEAKITCKKNTWTIKGWVEASNIYLNAVREKFIVKVTFTKSNEYKIVSFK